MQTKKTKIYVVTHCETCYNRRGIFTGRINSRLTPDGKKHAILLAVKLKNKKIDIAYISSLIRTKQTLNYILKYHKGIPVKVDDRLIERDYGDLSGKSKEKYKREHPDLFPKYHRSYDIAPPNGESMIEVEERVTEFINEIISSSQKDHKNILIIAHSNSIRPICKYFEHLTSEEMMKLEHLRHEIFEYDI